MKIISVDVGTKCGIAVYDHGKISFSTLNTTPKKNDHPGKRLSTFKSHFEVLFEGVDHVLYEKVYNHSSSAAAHLYGAFEGVLQLVALDKKIELQGYAVGTIKKFWTGAGNAKKEDMIEEAARRGFNVLDDNQADALAILHLFLSEKLIKT